MHAHQRETVCVKSLAGASSVPAQRLWGLALQRVIGVRRRRAELPTMGVEISVVSQCREGSPTKQSQSRSITASADSPRSLVLGRGVRPVTAYGGE
jgi:hypothetical protein